MEKPHWVRRFENYSRAFSLLREAIELSYERPLSPLEEEGVIQRFEYNWELAWKVMKDYLEAKGLVLPSITPATVIRAALAAKLIEDGETWIRALDTRNKMSDVDHFKNFTKAIPDIRAEYLKVFDALHIKLLEEVCESASS